jgi:glycosidase
MKNFSAIFFLILTNLNAFGQNYELKKIEPPHWWSGMKCSEIQLMLYGDNISDLEPSIDGICISEVLKTENPNYLFITINTAEKAPGNYKICLKKGKKTKLEIPYQLKERIPNSQNRKGFDNSDVVYLLMPDRFSNGDTTNDSNATTMEKSNRNLPGGRHGGDIRGIINHLDYIKELGATAIWSTPLLEDNDSSFSYHTYGQSDLYKIDPRYGTEKEFVELVSKMHEHGLKFIMDVVPNHWGAAHWMIKDLPTYNWIHQFPGYGQSNYRMTTQTDPYTSTIDQNYCTDGWFVRSMPDLNQENPLVLNYLIQQTIWWIEQANIDGLRVDTYSYNDKEGIAQWTHALRAEYPNMNIVGEVWMHDQALQSYWQANSPIGAIQSYNSNLPSVMDFTLHDAFMLAFSEANQGWDKGMIRFYENFANDFLYDNPKNILIFSENHDTQRFNQLYPNIEDYRLMLTLLATMRGIPQIYYGSEIGMKGDKNLGDADIRRDFPGGWANDENNAFKTEGRTSEQEIYYSFTKKILNWRKGSRVVQNGDLIQFIPQNNVYVYFRSFMDSAVMVIINNSLEEQKIALERFKEILSFYNNGKDIITDKSFNLEESNWIIKSKSSYIIELSK